VAQRGIAYVAGGWALLQGIDFLADAFHWPDATKQIATLVLLIGLPVVLVLAWFHGDRGEQRAGATEIGILAVLLLGGGAILGLYDPVNDAPTSAARSEAHIVSSGVTRTFGCDDLRAAVLQRWLPLNHDQAPRRKMHSCGCSESNHAARRFGQAIAILTAT
jgi:hypothetical protein